MNGTLVLEDGSEVRAELTLEAYGVHVRREGGEIIHPWQRVARVELPGQTSVYDRGSEGSGSAT
jgi:hypothetical protein